MLIKVYYGQSHKVLERVGITYRMVSYLMKRIIQSHLHMARVRQWAPFGGWNGSGHWYKLSPLWSGKPTKYWYWAGRLLVLWEGNLLLFFLFFLYQGLRESPVPILDITYVQVFSSVKCYIIKHYNAFARMVVSGVWLRERLFSLESRSDRRTQQETDSAVVGIWVIRTKPNSLSHTNKVNRNGKLPFLRYGCTREYTLQF